MTSKLDIAGLGWEDDPDCIAAADLIEALKRERDELLYLQSEVEAGDRIMQQRLEAAEARVAELTAERDLLQEIIDSRPAINAGLPETYIKWSQAIYSGEFVRAALAHKGEGRS